jgi:uncharacterized membrane protein YeaQ/YmgE (transglycosylase-associated protein family)
MTIGSILGAIIIGAIIGALGRLVVPGRQPIPIWVTIIVGIVAALIGSAIARSLGFAETGGYFDVREILVQVVLAAIGVVIAANLYARRGGRRGSLR